MDEHMDKVILQQARTERETDEVQIGVRYLGLNDKETEEEKSHRK